MHQRGRDEPGGGGGRGSAIAMGMGHYTLGATFVFAVWVLLSAIECC